MGQSSLSKHHLGISNKFTSLHAAVSEDGHLQYFRLLHHWLSLHKTSICSTLQKISFRESRWRIDVGKSTHTFLMTGHGK